MSQWKNNVLLWLSVFSFWIMFLICMPEHVCAQNSCPEVTQWLLKDGFHRDLVTRVTLGTVDEGMRNCMVAVKIDLPRGLYVDPYELASLNKHNITEALVTADYVDLELPEYLATEIDVLIYMKPDPECYSCFRAILPIHCRYHQPAEVDEKISAILRSPEILIHCQKSFLSTECLKETKIERPCSLKNKQNCHWDSVRFQAINQELKLQIPVGLKHHLTFVCTGTLVTTIFCSGLILFALFKHGDFLFVQSSL
ncbi:phosphatidylinositol-glycan biosynthesis class X protein [Sphaerodactylus townsendi]|uniref:phosphatidylinositol-glycan biosynthesis class X protein n=1 Tax=Sphaerodactylus townsendi TaxID=933632 RepID=UPI002025B7B4|nr:phosphatidylinositol-glycan biosynthesis class X protein [Sphaerodactylus townsendi]XP_048361985.1 phosphatidylinositol-glycan biosynthesis class X protein [Sphaerodactylus townsendi]